MKISGKNFEEVPAYFACLECGFEGVSEGHKEGCPKTVTEYRVVDVKDDNGRAIITLEKS